MRDDVEWYYEEQVWDVAQSASEYDYIWKHWSYADLYLAHMINKRKPG